MSDAEITVRAPFFIFSLTDVTALRNRANGEARRFIRAHCDKKVIEASDITAPSSITTDSTDKEPSSQQAPASSSFPIMPVQCHAMKCKSTSRSEGNGAIRDTEIRPIGINSDPHLETNEIQFLDTQEEEALISFYSSKFFSLIGPNAQVTKLQKDVKVVATASLLFRRFFLSNSVMMYDPKIVMVAAAFLASKVEDVTVDIRYLEEGTLALNAHVTISEILNAEVHLITGVNFELLCYHPYNSILAFTEDLRTFLKSDIGCRLVTFSTRDHENNANQGSRRILAGEDLRPIHDQARKIADDAIVSDIPLFASPGQIGLAAMIVANDDLLSDEGKVHENHMGDTDETLQNKRIVVPHIDFQGYIQNRFGLEHNYDELRRVWEQIMNVCKMLRGLKEGKYGCGNYFVNLDSLKQTHKKLKACRAWGGGPSVDGKKKKKRKRED